MEKISVQVNLVSRDYLLPAKSFSDALRDPGNEVVCKLNGGDGD